MMNLLDNNVSLLFLLEMCRDNKWELKFWSQGLTLGFEYTKRHGKQQIIGYEITCHVCALNKR